MKRSFCCFAVIVGTIAITVAQRADAEAMLTGAGTFSCAQFANFYKDSPLTEAPFYSWAQGFMSGLNVGFMSELNVTSIPITDLTRTDFDQELFLRLYCDRHPLALYLQAVYALFDQMRVRQGLPLRPD